MNIYVNKKGFTLPELMVVITVSTLMMVVFMGFFVSMLGQYVTNDARSQTLTEVHVALDTLTDDVRLAAAADTNNRWQDQNAPGAPSNLQSWESSSSTLVLATAAENASGTILFDDPSQYLSHKNNIIYFVSNGILYRRVLAAEIEGNNAVTTCPTQTESCPVDRVLLRDVSEFSVDYVDALDNEVEPSNARSIRVSISVSKEKFNQPITVNYQTRMVFRNV